MKYKLLSENGVLFLCMENGVRFPYQIKSVVSQNCMDKAEATVSAYIDKRVGCEEDKRLEVDFANNKVYFMGKLLTGIKSLSYFENDELPMTCIEFKVDAVYGDTAEKPINPNA